MFRVLLFLLIPLSAWADVGLLRWQPSGFAYAFLLPQKENESAKDALKRYRNSLKSDPQLKDFAKALRLAKGGSLTAYLSPETPAVAALANAEGDLRISQERMKKVLDPLARKGADAVVIPVAATASLEPKEAEEFRALLNQDFDAMLAVGGEDIHPSLYGDPDPQHLAVNTNLSRDKEELEIVRSYLSDGKGFFSGICRGHQMGGVASSCRLIKDIEAELELSHPYGKDHKIVIGGKAGALTKQLFGPDKEITVMSLHHQSVMSPGRENKLVRVTGFAKGKRKIAEVSEYAGGRGLSVQTHPELMRGAFHQRYYDLVFSKAEEASKERLAEEPAARAPLGAYRYFRPKSCALRFKALD